MISGVARRAQALPVMMVLRIPLPRAKLSRL
jgi:hypothetical protein